MEIRKLGDDVVKLTSSKIIVMLISLVSAMLLSRFRTLEEYGTYSQILTSINLVTALFMLGLPNSINYFVNRAKTSEEKKEFLNVYYSLSTVLSIMSGVVLLLSTPLIIKYYDNILIKSFWYFLVVFPWTKLITGSIENVLISYNKTSLIVIYRIANGFVLLTIILVSQWLKIGFAGYMFFYLMVEILFTLSVYIIVRKVSGSLRISFDFKIIKMILTFSIPIGLASTVGTLSIELDKLIIGRFFSVEELAIYSNASRELPLTIIATSFTAILMPQMVKLLNNKKNKEAIKLWGNAIILSYGIIAFLAIGIFTFAPDVLTLLYSKKYLPGVNVFRIYNIVILFRFTYFGMLLNSMGKTKFILFSSIGSLILNTILNVIFYYLIGFEGPAWATLVSILAMAVLQVVITAKNVGISFRNIFPWKYLVSITLTNILLATLFFIIKQNISLDFYIGSLLESILLAILWGIIYIIVMFKLFKKNWFELNAGRND